VPFVQNLSSLTVSLLQGFAPRVSTWVPSIINQFGVDTLSKGGDIATPPPPPDNIDKSDHHTTHGKPLCRHQRPRGCQHIGGRLSSESLINETHLQTISSHHQRSRSTPSARADQTSCPKVVPTLRARSRCEQAMGKGISTGAEAAFRIRNARGSRVGEKGFKVATAVTACCLYCAVVLGENIFFCIT
jgi:hypothetical protein